MRASLLSLCTIVFAVAGLAGDLRAGDWPGFRGPQHNGISTDDKIPTAWGDDKNLAWKLELPGKGVSSPIVVGDRVIVTCYSGRGGELKRHLVCVNRESGKIEWQKAVQSGGPEPGRGFGRDHGSASHTPVSDGKNIYVVFGTTGALAFDMSGKQLWKANIGRENNSRFGSAASPILYKNMVIVTAANESATIRGLDKKTGKELWKAEAGPLTRSYSTPIIAKNDKGEDQLIVSVPYEIWGMNPEKGKLKWYAKTEVDTAACTSAVVDGSMVYIVGGRGGGRTAVKVGGKGDVTKTNVKWSERGGATSRHPSSTRDTSTGRTAEPRVVSKPRPAKKSAGSGCGAISTRRSRSSTANSTPSRDSMGPTSWKPAPS